MKKYWSIFTFCVLLCTLFITGSVFAQQSLTFPRTSQHAKVMQTVGLTEITVDYHSPGVKGRKIWGELESYGKIWRAGANENTTISFSDPVKIEGKELPAGTYGLHILLEENEWTFILSNTSTAWGSYAYDESEDAVRIKVTPQKAEHREWLSFDFVKRQSNSVELMMHWEKLKASFKINVDVQGLVLENMKRELKSLPRFRWNGWHQAANYCYQNNFNHEEALQWVDRSISMNENFSNLQVKSGLLEQTGKAKESEEIMKKAIDIANERDLYLYGRRFLRNNEIAKAIEIFEINVKKHPNSWNVHNRLAEAYLKSGDKKKAKKSYQTALKKLPKDDESNKERITLALKEL